VRGDGALQVGIFGHDAEADTVLDRQAAAFAEFLDGPD
jgi:hypothetical protein